MKDQDSSVFTLEPLQTSIGTEQILRGGRRLLTLLPKAFEGISQIGIIGWGKQGPAQAQNLRDSLEAVGSDIVVKVGLQEGSKSVESANAAGFTEDDETLGEMFEVISTSDLVILLISDGAQTKLYPQIFDAMKVGATLGLSHGFLLGHLESVNESFPEDINVILMAPKGMGDSVRRLYVQGQSVDGAGINSSVAVEQDVNGHALDYALGWAVATGSPVTFFTTMRNEVVSDLTGERAMLLGLVWALVEALYDFYRFLYADPKQAFLNSCKGLTSTVAEMISEHGLLGFYDKLDQEFQIEFRRGYQTAYGPVKQLIEDIYTNVASLKEIQEVVEATAALEHTPMSIIDRSEMWGVATAENLYEAEAPITRQLAFSAGMYVAGIMAGMQVLILNGHCVSEAVNEQLIEIIDSLLPYLDKIGIKAMVDGCSITARLGTRKWGLSGYKMFNKALNAKLNGGLCFEEFLRSPLHGDVQRIYSLRPSVKIAVN